MKHFDLTPFIPLSIVAREKYCHFFPVFSDGFCHFFRVTSDKGDVPWCVSFCAVARLFLRKKHLQTPFPY